MKITELPLGVYVPGNTLVHRASPTGKFMGLLSFIIAMTILPTQPWHSGIALGAVLIFYATAQIPSRTTWRQVAPVLPLLAFLGIFLWWQNGWVRTATTLLSLLATIMAAALLTLTTTIDELMNALESNLQPLSKIGVPADTISLAIALTIRHIPVILNTANESVDARKARGASFSLLAFGTPLVIRSLRRAQLAGEALMARGATD